MGDMEQTRCQKCCPIHEYIYRDVYTAHQLRVIDDALFQAMPHIKHTLIQFFGVVKFCTVDSLPHF